MKLETAWANDACLNWEGHCPETLLERLMANERCAAFGPIHHYLVGAALLTCMSDALPCTLESALEALEERAGIVPGATCARWGVCGAAASCGMAFAIAAENAPLKVAGWSEGQAMVSDILAKIAVSGAPRCCKRDSRIAAREAVPWFNRYFSTRLEQSTNATTCASATLNSVCVGPNCPYHREAQL